VESSSVQDASSQLMFPLEVAMHLDDEEAAPGGGSLPDLPRVPSTCSTAAYQEAYAAAAAASKPLVLGSAPAAPITLGKGILHNSSTKINRKNSQVCFRDDCEVDSPLLPQRQHPPNQPPGEPFAPFISSTYAFNLISRETPVSKCVTRVAFN